MDWFLVVGSLMVVGAIALWVCALAPSRSDISELLGGEQPAPKDSATETAGQNDHPWVGYRRFRVERTVKESRRAQSFYFKPVDNGGLPPFDPGQYLQLHFSISRRETMVSRCYSLSDRSGADYYRISVNRQEGGLISNHLHDTVKQGDIVGIKTPGGDFMAECRKGDRPLVFIAGGIGITPFISYLNQMKASNSKRVVVLLYQLPNSDEHAFNEDLKQLEQDLPGFVQVIYFSRQRAEDAGKYHIGGRMEIEQIDALLGGSPDPGVASTEITRLRGEIQRRVEAAGYRFSPCAFEYFLCAIPMMIEQKTAELAGYDILLLGELLVDRAKQQTLADMLPREGNGLIVIAREEGIASFHIRILRAGQATPTIDGDDQSFAGKADECSALRLYLSELWNRDELTIKQRARIRELTAKITGCKAVFGLGVPESQVFSEKFNAGGKTVPVPPGLDISFSPSDKVVRTDGEAVSIMQLADDSGENIAIPRNCCTGTCGTCESMIVGGKKRSVKYAEAPKYKIAPGNCLPCVAFPQRNLRIEPLK